MVKGKKVADAITLTRLLVGIWIACLGISLGRDGLPCVVGLMILNWTGDFLDGIIARRSKPFYHTWIGDHDLEVDMAVATELLIYLILSRFADPVASVAYLAVWGVFLVKARRVPPSLGMLFQAPIYGWFIWVAIREDAQSGLLLPAWILVIVAVTWPRFPKEIVPRFLAGLGDVGKKGTGPVWDALRKTRASDRT